MKLNNKIKRLFLVYIRAMLSLFYEKIHTNALLYFNTNWYTLICISIYGVILRERRYISWAVSKERVQM
jgi:hypothetical protein